MRGIITAIAGPGSFVTPETGEPGLETKNEIETKLANIEWNRAGSL